MTTARASSPRRWGRSVLGLAVVASTLLGAGWAGAWVQSLNDAGGRTEWNIRSIPFWLNARGSTRLDLDATEEAVVDSFARWDAIDCVELEFQYEGQTDSEMIGFLLEGPNQNIVLFRGEGDTWLHRPEALAVTTVSSCESVGSFCDFTGEIIDTDIEVNEVSFRFSVDAPIPALHFSLRNTLIHEVGHVLGLDHSPVEDATMFADARPRETSKESLHADDISAICTIYASIHAETAPQDDCAAMPGGGSAPVGWLWGLGLVALVGWRVRRSALASAGPGPQ